jgi:hypothetical protein
MGDARNEPEHNALVLLVTDLAGDVHDLKRRKNASAWGFGSAVALSLGRFGGSLQGI